MACAPLRRFVTLASIGPIALAVILPGPATGDEAASAISSAHAVEVARRNAVQETDLAVIRKRPVFFRGKTVTFTVQLGTQNETWNPQLTRFDTERYRSWQGWAESQVLWHYTNFQNPSPRLFALRGGDAAHAFAGASSYARFEVSAIVRTVFLGEPWIEIVSARALENSLVEGTLLHASRAMEFVADERFRAAAEQYKRALDAPMPKGMEARMRSELEAAEEKAKPIVDEPSSGVQ